MTICPPLAASRHVIRLSYGRVDCLSEADLRPSRGRVLPLTVAHHKFRFQLEGEKSQGTSLQREIQGLQESVVELQKKTEKLQHDLGSKETQNNWLQV